MSSIVGSVVSTARIVSFPEVVAVVRSVVSEVREREITFLAAAISYYTLVSLVPLLVLAVVVAVFVGGEGLQAQILTYVQENLPAAEEYVETALVDRTAQGGLGVTSVLVTLWGGLKVFRGFDVAFSRIYGSEPGGLVDQIRDAVMALVSLAAGVIGAVALVTAMAVLDLPFVGLASPLFLLVVLIVGFFPFYYVFPDADVAFGEVAPGTVFAAVGYTLLASFFGVYASLTAGVAGALGAVLLLVTYFYFAGMVLLTGAVINAVLGGRIEDRQVQHA